ncbi:hypothetical protein [Amycolatopsis sp. NPDC054798]
MAKFRCVCDYVISTSGEIPNPLEWKVISDQKFDEFEGMVDAEAVYLAGTSMFRCPQCGCLWVFWNGFAEPPECYAPQPIPEGTDGS